jgi:hypothetical protein
MRQSKRRPGWYTRRASYGVVSLREAERSPTHVVYEVYRRGQQPSGLIVVMPPNGGAAWTKGGELQPEATLKDALERFEEHRVGYNHRVACSLVKAFLKARFG